MAARSFMAGNRGAAVAATLSGMAALSMPHRTLYAEAPSAETPPVRIGHPSEIVVKLIGYLQLKRKPIYDDLPSSNAPTSDTNSSSSSSSSSSSPAPHRSSPPRPTDRLATQIGRGRLFVHDYAARSEDWVNATLARGLDLESSFTRTVAGLAPDPATGERVLPGALYVAVATMAGSILARRRNLLLRGVTPVAAGLAAGWALLPHTMRNVGDLVWTYEERVPVVALNHLRVRGALEQGWRETTARSQAVRRWTDQRAGEARETIEAWVRKGR